MGTILVIPFAVRDGRGPIASLATSWHRLLANDALLRLQQTRARIRLLRRAEELAPLQPSFAADLRAAAEEENGRHRRPHCSKSSASV